jgi:hypothetical protein
MTFQELDLFLSSGEGPLERANLNHWATHVKVKVTL